MRAVLDSVILIDALNGIDSARTTLSRLRDSAISTISWIEVLAGARDESDRVKLKGFLRQWAEIPLDADIAEHAALLRSELRLRLADAAILATARLSGRTLVTRNTKDFRPGMAGIHIPYRLRAP
jgi:predicted nucleic acid-binding protein